METFLFPKAKMIQICKPDTILTSHPDANGTEKKEIELSSKILCVSMVGDKRVFTFLFLHYITKY